MTRASDDDTDEVFLDRGSSTVSPRLDDALRHDTEGLTRSGHQTRAEEYRGSEPSGDDEPPVTLEADGPGGGGTPEGMTPGDVSGRSELATYLARAPYPVVREQLLELVIDRQAPDHVVEEVRRLPAGRTFDTVSDVWSALGGHVEQHRF